MKEPTEVKVAFCKKIWKDLVVKRFIAIFVLFLTTGTFVQADPIFGQWRTAPDENGYTGLIEMTACGNVICGKLLQSFDDQGNPFNSEFDGKFIITETVPRGDGTYRGRAFSPDRRKTYDSRLSLAGDQLNVRGCILGVCRDGGTWARQN